MKLSSGIALFSIGIMTGLALDEPAPARASTAPSAELVQVQETGPTERAITKRLEAKPGPQHGRGAARGVAKRALEFTVHIRGGAVYGSGVVLDRKGHVLTADHVIDGVREVEVSFHDQPRRFPATVVERDKKLDLALLRIDAPIATVASTAPVAELRMGDEIFGMGSPRKMEFSLSRGVVSYVGRSFDGALFIQTDLPANSGSSGGPVMNEQGDVIGISSFILKNSQGLAFAVPVDYAFVRFGKVLGKRDTSEFERWVHARRGGPTKR